MNSSDLWHRARTVIPGGVNSPVRAMRSVGIEEPLFAARQDADRDLAHRATRRR